MYSAYKQIACIDKTCAFMQAFKLEIIKFLEQVVH